MRLERHTMNDDWLTMTDDWLTMTEEEKYAEWSQYMEMAIAQGWTPKSRDYSEYCDWMDEWERTHG